jgi:hypothetical protein
MTLPKRSPVSVSLLYSGLMVYTAWAAQDSRADEPRPPGPVQLPGPRPLKPEDDASSLVRSIREQESWIDRVESLSLKAEVLYETTPAGIAKRRRELQQQRPAGADIEGNRGLRPRTVETIELAFDRKRVRWWEDGDPAWFDLRVWDGHRLIVYSSYDTPPDRREYQIGTDPTRALPGLLDHFYSFRAGPRRLWWAYPPEDRESVIRLMGWPEDFVYGGREFFHGTECHVASCWANWSTFYISVGDGRLRGARVGALRSPEKRLLNWLNRKGHSFRDTKEVWAWIRSRPPEEARALAREESAALPRLVDPVFDYWLSDDREIAPGSWLPMTQTSNLYFLDEGGRLAIDQTCRLKITEAKVNVPLPDAMYRVELPQGARIVDRTKGTPGDKR